jgi:hypothetical protein
MARGAVLIFANSLAADLARRGWSRRMAGALEIPRIDGNAVGADVHVFTPAGSASADRFGKPEVRNPKSESMTDDEVRNSSFVIDSDFELRNSDFSHNPSAEADPTESHPQRGRDFGQRLENAVEELAALGYDKIVIVGRDCPELSQEDVASALAALDEHRLVIGPDHRGGCYLIAIHARDRQLLHHVRWQNDTDCEALLDRFGREDALVLEVKVDVDGTGDLRLVKRLARLIDVGMVRSVPVCEPKGAYLELISRWQRPPPGIAA